MLPLSFYATLRLIGELFFFAAFAHPCLEGTLDQLQHGGGLESASKSELPARPSLAQVLESADIEREFRPQAFGPASGKAAYISALRRLAQVPQDTIRLGEPKDYPDRVEMPIKGLYESIPVDKVLKAGDLKIYTHEGLYNYSSFVYSAGKQVGVFFRRIDRVAGEIDFEGAKLDGILDTNFPPPPRFISVPGVIPLVDGKGVPTQALATLHEMRLAQVPYGSLKTAKSNSISNARTSLELIDSLPVRKWNHDHPGKPVPGDVLAQAILGTHSARYMETVLTQSGHRIVGVKVVRGYTSPLSKIISNAGGSLDSSLLSSLVEEKLPDGTLIPFSPDTPVPTGFEIQFRLAPIR